MAGRVIGSKGGPPKGTRNAAANGFARGERGCYDALDRATKLVGSDHPIVKECLETLLEIARGADGYRGRHIGDRLRATTQLLDRLAGTPRKSEPVGKDHSDVDAFLDHLESGDVG